MELWEGATFQRYVEVDLLEPQEQELLPAVLLASRLLWVESLTYELRERWAWVHDRITSSASYVVFLRLL